jgi:hypothetical protein
MLRSKAGQEQETSLWVRHTHEVLTQILDTDFKVQLTSTGHNVLTGRGGEALHQRVRFGQTFQTCKPKKASSSVIIERRRTRTGKYTPSMSLGRSEAFCTSTATRTTGDTLYFMVTKL